MEKLTFEQILSILKDKFILQAFAEQYNLIPDEFEYSDNVKVIIDAEQVALDKYRNHPHYDNYKERSEEFERLYNDYISFNSYALMKKEYFESLGVGEYEVVDEYGGEGCGDIWYVVFYFKEHNVYMKIYGFYSSYNGVTFGSWDSATSEVTPIQVTKTEYVEKQNNI